MRIPFPATSPSRAPAAPNPARGIFWMVLTGFCFVAVTAIVKHLGGALPAAESAFLRYVLGLAFLLPLLPAILRARPGGPILTLAAIRGLAHGLGVILWFFAMARIPMAEVTAMNYLVPVYVAVGAALFLGERFALRRTLAIAAALVGTLLILRPGFREIAPGHLAMLGTAGLFALSYLLAKRLSGLVSPVAVVGLLSLTVPIALAPFALVHWVPPTTAQLAWLFLVAAFATTGHYTMTLAFRAAPITVTQPATFLQLVWATAVGALFFSEPVDGWVIAGGGLIIAAVSFIAWRETRLKRAPAPPTAP